MSHLLESLFLMDGDNIRPVIDGKKIQVRNSAGINSAELYYSTPAGVLNSFHTLDWSALGEGYIKGSSGGVALLLQSSTNTLLKIGVSEINDEVKFGVSDQGGNQFIFTNYLNFAKDHDVPAQTDPLLGIFSDTDPDVDNTQNILFWHDKTDGNCQVNKGEMNFDIYDGFLNIKRRSDANDILMAGHDGTDGKVDTQTGQLKLRAASDVVIKRGTAAINSAMATDEILFYFAGGHVHLNYYDGAAWQTKNLTV